jgi:hypothetical protein
LASLTSVPTYIAARQTREFHCLGKQRTSIESSR